MPKIMHIAVRLELDTNEWTEAVQKVAIKPIYEQFITALDAAGVRHEATIGTAHADAAPPRTRKPRAPRLAKAPPATLAAA